MASEDSVVEKMMSYFSETNTMDKFKRIFIEEIGKDPKFQEKLKELTDPETSNLCFIDELLMRRIIESDNGLLLPDVKERIFKLWGELLDEMFKTTEA